MEPQDSDDAPVPDYKVLDLHGPFDEPPAPPPPSRTLPTILAALLIVGLGGAAGYYVYRTRSASAPGASEAAQPAPSTDAPTPLGTSADAIDLPPLDESDEAVRTLVAALTSNPTVAAWLATDDLIRTFTVVVSNIASGESPARHVPVLKPRGRFLVLERGEDLLVSPRSYARYSSLATAASAIHAEGVARLYTTLKPRIEEAYRELGEPDTPFDQTLEHAIVLLLRTPIPDGPVSVEPSGAISYRFADRTLEKLNPAQKLLIRFGPDNQREVQTSLRAIALALGIPGERLQ